MREEAMNMQYLMPGTEFNTICFGRERHAYTQTPILRRANFELLKSMIDEWVFRKIEVQVESRVGLESGTEV